MPTSRSRRKGRRALALRLAAIWLLEACSAGWHQPAELGATPLQPRQQVQVWRQATMARWHAVVLSTDTVSGIPYREPIDCDTCRIAFPRATVDSIRLGSPVAGFWKSVGLVVGAMLAVCFLGCPRDTT